MAKANLNSEIVTSVAHKIPVKIKRVN